MALLNSTSAVLVRVKVGTDADPDILDPTVALVWKPGVGQVVGPSEIPLQTPDPKTTFAWSSKVTRTGAPSQPVYKLLIKVSVRDVNNAEITTGVTWSAYAFLVLPPDKDELLTGQQYTDIRPSVMNLGDIAAQPVAKPAVLDVGQLGHVGVCFTAFAGGNVGDVSTVLVWAQEWG